MALRACRECKEMVSEEAKNCPHCGIAKPTKNHNHVLLIIAWVVAVTFIASGLAGHSLTSSDSLSASPDASSLTSEDVSTPVIVATRIEESELQKLRQASFNKELVSAVNTEISRLKESIKPNKEHPESSLIIADRAQFDADLQKLGALMLAAYWFKYPTCFGVVSWMPNPDGPRDLQGRLIENCIGTNYTSPTNSQDNAQYEASARALAIKSQAYVAELAAAIPTNTLEQPTTTSDDPCEGHQCVTAKIGHPLVPGAIVCRDYDTVTLMIERYKASWEDNFRASVIGPENEKLMHGAPRTPPALARFDCILLPPGTPMKWDGNWMPAIVTIKLTDGTIRSGVTDPSMIDNTGI